MSSHAVDHRAHTELADAEEDVAAGGVDVEAGRVLEDGLGGGREVSGSTEEFRNDACDGIHDDLTGVAGGDGLGIGTSREDGNLLLPVLGELGFDGAFELSSGLWVGLLVLLELLLPRVVGVLATELDGVPVGACFVGHVEGLVFGPAEILLGGLDCVCAERFAMNLAGAGLGAAVADDGADADERGLGRLSLGCKDCVLDRLEIVAVGDVLDVPVIGLEAPGHIFGKAELGGAVERDEVVVVEDDELAEAEGAGQRCGLMRDAFHHVAVAAEDVGVVIDDVVGVAVVDGGEVLLCRGDADSHAEALTERAGGDLDAGGLAVLGVAGGVRSPLAELLELLHGKVVTGEVQRAVEQRGGVAVRQDEAVAVDPLGVRGIVLHQLVVQQIGDGGAAEGRAGVAGLGFFNSIDGEEAEGVDGKLI